MNIPIFVLIFFCDCLWSKYAVGEPVYWGEPRISSVSGNHEGIPILRQSTPKTWFDLQINEVSRSVGSFLLNVKSMYASWKSASSLICSWINDAWTAITGFVMNIVFPRDVLDYIFNLNGGYVQTERTSRDFEGSSIDSLSGDLRDSGITRFRQLQNQANTDSCQKSPMISANKENYLDSGVNSNDQYMNRYWVHSSSHQSYQTYASNAYVPPNPPVNKYSNPQFPSPEILSKSQTTGDLASPRAQIHAPVTRLMQAQPPNTMAHSPVSPQSPLTATPNPSTVTDMDMSIPKTGILAGSMKQGAPVAPKKMSDSPVMSSVNLRGKDDARPAAKEKPVPRIHLTSTDSTTPLHKHSTDVTRISGVQPSVQKESQTSRLSPKTAAATMTSDNKPLVDRIVAEKVSIPVSSTKISSMRDIVPAAGLSESTYGRQRQQQQQPYGTVPQYENQQQPPHPQQQQQQHAYWHKPESQAAAAALPAFSMTDNWKPQGALAPDTITREERVALDQLRVNLATFCSQGDSPRWLRSVTDVELLRFLRARAGDASEAWNMMFKHCAWRGSELGPDSITPADAHRFASSPLNREVYWAGEALDGCPTLIVRTALHAPGTYEPDFYIRFVVWMLERGRREFGVGTHRQLCVVVDRSPAPLGEETTSKSMTVMLPLFKRLFALLQDNYPEILFKAFVVPVNWIFWSMYSIASSVIDERSRRKITMVKETEFAVWWQAQFPPRIIPFTIGGVAPYPHVPSPTKYAT